MARAATAVPCDTIGVDTARRLAWEHAARMLRAAQTPEGLAPLLDQVHSAEDRRVLFTASAEVLAAVELRSRLPPRKARVR